MSEVDPWGLYSISENGITHFFTNFKFLKNFSIPTPPGWEDYTEEDEIPIIGKDLYHEYNRKVQVNGLTQIQTNDLQDFIIRHPTPPTNSKPATRSGVYNKASPNVGPFAENAGAMAVMRGTLDYVYSYIRTGTNGRPYVVNVTAHNHSLAFGIVIRGIECMGNRTIVHNYGEGNGFYQTFGLLSHKIANNVWYWHTELALEEVTGKKYNVNGRDWTKEVKNTPIFNFPAL